MIFSGILPLNNPDGKEFSDLLQSNKRFRLLKYFYMWMVRVAKLPKNNFVFQGFSINQKDLNLLILDEAELKEDTVSISL